MLNEIINYVQSLENQVEFLSMKLISMNPMFYDFGMDLDELMVRPEKMSTSTMVSPMPLQPQCTNYPLLDSSTSVLLQQEQCPNTMFQVGLADVIDMYYEDIYVACVDSSNQTWVRPGSLRNKELSCGIVANSNLPKKGNSLAHAYIAIGLEAHISY